MDQVGQAQFGTWLRQQRKSHRLTQEDLAELLACSSVLVQKIEAGDRTSSAQLASLIADWLDIPRDGRHAFSHFARGQLGLGEAEARFGYAAGTRNSFPGNLPAPLTSFIGRTKDVQTVNRLLLGKEGRLLSLTGPPGIGKTRLALEAARHVTDRFRDGVFFVALASIVDPDLVVAAIVHALGLHAQGTESLVSKLQQSLSSKELLLLLDNFEQVLDASPLVLELLGACPNLKVLVTSREALYIYGEQQYHVTALSTADPSNLPPLPTLESIPAVALFLDRARAVKPGFVLTEENAKAIASICKRLDGLPLAIELAAALIRLFSPQEMLSRLDSRLSLLTGGPRNLPPRQRTLRAAIDWSYNLLTNEEQTLFARLGVFVGGFTLPAVEAVCGMWNAGIPISPSVAALSLDLPQGIGSLLDKNLLKREEGVDEESRFTMLQLIGDYSSERLQASREEQDIRGLHARYFLSMAEAGEKEMGQGTKQLWLSRLEREHDNIRGTLRWLLNTGKTDNATLALRLSGAMRTFWHSRGHDKEGRRWLEEALAAAVEAPAAVRAKGLRTRGHLAQVEGDFRQSVEWLEESLALYKEEGDMAGILAVTGTLAFLMVLQGDLERAIALGKEALALGFDPALQAETASLLYSIAGAALYQSDFAQAEEFATKGLVLSREQGDEETCTGFLNILGLAAHYQGDYSRAEAFYGEGLSIARQIGFHGRMAHICVNMADMALLQGEQARAAPLLAEGLSIFVKMGDKHGIAEGLEGMATLAGALGQPDRAARLFGAAEVLREVAKIFLPTFARVVYERTMATSRSRIGEEAFTKAWAEGRAMDIEEAIQYALSDLPAV
jgi:predicted ATPase/transcriptional regulator with XRE-family HTH domain